MDMASCEPLAKPACTQCKVCNDEASGFHYGVDSCEGCKGFFRRCILQGMNQRCTNNELCEITPLTRNSCQHCRLKKCFTVGMSRGASRLGRRPKCLKSGIETSPKRIPTLPAKPLQFALGVASKEAPTLTMTELKHLIEKLHSGKEIDISLESLLKMLNRTDNPVERALTLNQATETQARIQSQFQGSKDTKTVDRSSPLNGQYSPDTTAADDSTSSKYERLNVEPVNHIENRNICEQRPFSVISKHYKNQGNSVFDLAAKPDAGVFNRAAQLGDQSFVQRQQQDPKLLNDHFATNCFQIGSSSKSPNASISNAAMCPPVVLCNGNDYSRHALSPALIEAAKLSPDVKRLKLIEDVINAIVNAHMNTCIYTREKVAAKLHLYEETSRSEPQMINQIYQNSVGQKTNPDQMWTEFLENMEPVIRRVVSFSKSIPGFSEFGQSDQIKLIKQGSFEVILARYTPLFTDKGMFIPDMTVCVPREIVRMMALGEFFEEQFRFAEVFNRLHLNDGEVGLLAAIMIMNPERSEIVNRKAIYRMRGLLLQALYIYLKWNHPDCYDDIFSRTISILPLSGRINELHVQTLNNIKMTSPHIKFPDLHSEVYDGAP